MQVRLLGAMEAVDERGTPLSVQGAKLRALLAMLALDAGQVVSTDRLIDGLWHDDPPAGVANSLQRLVSKLRKTLGSADAVAMRPPGYVLAIDPADVDVHRFDQLVAEVRELAELAALEQVVSRCVEAGALWRGPALADFAYDDFAQPHIARLEEARLSVHEARADAELALGRHQHLIGDLEVLVRDHPTRERFRAQLMLAMYRAGRQADALRVFQEGRRVLADELGLDPGVELRDLERAILAQDATLDAPTAAPAAAAIEPPRRRTNVKPSLSPLVGREPELAELDALSRASRLVTIIGPGGAGKTRLAMETASRSVASTDADVIVVELAAVTTPDAVAPTIAADFGLPEPHTDSLARVRAHCEGRQVLVVLDNCEHLVTASAEATAALLEGSEIRVLATSREALRVPGEAVWAVPPLQEVDAVGLFIARATAADASFTTTAEASAIVASICARLDGLPLAIELAAARTRAFTVGQIAERLDDRFRLLSGGARTAMARQQTLRAVVDWSYDLLFEDERRVFERLSVFPGGCTIAIAEDVCADDELDRTEVLECVAALVDKSLLVVDRSGDEARYRMLQTLSQYGRERLVERGDADAAFGRMARRMADICAGGRAAWRGVRQGAWFQAVDAERDNIAAAFEWAVGAEEKDLAVALAADIAFDRWIAGGTVEGYRWLEVSLGLPGDLADPFLSGWARHWRAFLGFVAGPREGFEQQFEEAIDLLQRHADPVFVAYALSFEAQLVDAVGRRERSIERNHALLAALETTSDPWARPATSWARAALAIQERSDYDAFESHLRDATDEFRQIGDLFMTAVCLDLVAELAETRGDLADARANLTEALGIVSGQQMRSFEAALLARLARAAMSNGDDDAELLVQRALGRSDDVVFRPGRAMSLNTLANLRRRQGRLDEASAAALDALDLYEHAPHLRFSSSFSRAPTAFDVPVGASTSLSALGFVAEAEGDAALAVDRYRAAYEVVAATAHPRAIPLALEGLAAAMLLSGDAPAAARLLGCSDSLREAFGTVRVPTEQSDVDRIERAVIVALGDEGFRAAHDEGAELPAEALVERSVTDQR